MQNINETDSAFPTLKKKKRSQRYIPFSIHQWNLKPFRFQIICAYNDNSGNSDNDNSDISTDNTLKYTDVSYSELKLTIKKIQIHKSSGIKGISSNIFKIAAQKILIKQFRFLFNLVIRSGVFCKSKKTQLLPHYLNQETFQTQETTDPQRAHHYLANWLKNVFIIRFTITQKSILMFALKLYNMIYIEQVSH